MRRVTPEELAERIHSVFEALAPTYGWDTQAASRTAWDDVPEENRNLMVATCEDVLGWLDDGDDAQPGPPVPTVITPRGSMDHEVDRDILEVEEGGHRYPGWDSYLQGGPGDFFTSECDHGCGALLGRTAAEAPAGVDPFGECPEHPDKVGRGLDDTIAELTEEVPDGASR